MTVEIKAPAFQSLLQMESSLHGTKDRETASRETNCW